MARRPKYALQDWPGLDQSERDTILWAIMRRYGIDFAARFREYANGQRQPDYTIHATNFPTPESLAAHGWHYAGVIGGLPTWVHPSGQEVWLMGQSTESGSQSSEASTTDEDEESTPFERRCINPCLLDTEDEAECHDCCGQIPESDARCRRACNVSCNFKI